MRTLLAVLFLICSVSSAWCQQVIATSGGSSTVSGYKVDWTLGEPVIETFTGTSHILTQGMHQTKLLVTSLEELKIPSLEVKVYPNPVGELLIVEVIQAANDQFEYELTDSAGRKALISKMHTSKEAIDMQRYVPGIYLLRIFSATSGVVKVCKISKN